MKLKTWHFAALVPLILLASNGAVGAELAALGLTMGIFFGTLALSRPGAQSATSTNQ